MRERHIERQRERGEDSINEGDHKREIECNGQGVTV